MSIRVLIADDHRPFLEGLRALLASVDRFEIVGEATDGAQALELLRACIPEVAVLDVAMPGMSGLEIAETARRDGLGTRLVLLTMYRAVDMVHRALDAGVAGYVLKDRAYDDLVVAIDQAAAGAVFVSPTLITARR